MAAEFQKVFALDATTTTGTLAVDDALIGGFGKISVQVPSGLTVDFGVSLDGTTFVTPYSVTGVVGTSVAGEQIFAYGEASVRAFKITRTAGSGSVFVFADAEPSASAGRITATVTINPGDIEIGSVEMKDAATDIRAKVKSDGTDNAIVVTQNTVPALVAGTAVIGQVGIDQTTPGTTNKVTVGSDVVHTIIDSGTVTAVTGITNALPAGTNILGQVGIDQTTPGTTNGVQVNAALPAGTNNIGDIDIASIAAGSNVIGQVSIDQTTPGTTNKVTVGSDVVHTIIDSGTVTAVTAITNALPAGTNAIGKLSSNSGVDIGDVDVTSLPAITIAASQTLDTVTTVGAVTAITNALPAGTNAIGKLAANSGVDIGDVDILSLPALPTGSNVIGKVELTDGVDVATIRDVTLAKALDVAIVDGSGAQITSFPVTGITNALPAGTNTIGNVALVGAATTGLSRYRTIDLDESEEEIKGSAGTLYDIYFYNASTSVRYLKLYNALAADVTVGTTTPVDTYPLPSSMAGNISVAQGIKFTTAITAAVTTGLADNDTGAPSANDVICNFYYL